MLAGDCWFHLAWQHTLTGTQFTSTSCHLVMLAFLAYSFVAATSEWIVCVLIWCGEQRCGQHNKYDVHGVLMLLNL
jgi:hypothetical protein